MIRLSAPPSSARPPAEGVVSLGLTRWRVLRASGAVAGLVEETRCAQGVRYRALRYRWSVRAFHPVGDFWRFDDAVAALRAG